CRGSGRACSAPLARPARLRQGSATARWRGARARRGSQPGKDSASPPGSRRSAPLASIAAAQRQPPACLRPRRSRAAASALGDDLDQFFQIVLDAFLRAPPFDGDVAEHRAALLERGDFVMGNGLGIAVEAIAEEIDEDALLSL